MVSKFVSVDNEFNCDQKNKIRLTALLEMNLRQLMVGWPVPTALSLRQSEVGVWRFEREVVLVGLVGLLFELARSSSGKRSINH